MSYNGIGLSTARGSGTNGYVQKNIGSKASLGHYERRRAQAEEKDRHYAKSSKVGKAKKDQGLEEHDRRRAIEVECAALRDKLEDDDDLDDNAIEEQVRSLRKRLVADQQAEAAALEKARRIQERHYHSVHGGEAVAGIGKSTSEKEADEFMKSFGEERDDVDY